MIKNKGCCDLEYARKIKELGVKQDSLWYHIMPCQSHGMIPWGKISDKKRADKWNPEYIYSAPTVAELLDSLPNTILVDEIIYEFYLMKDDRGCIVGYKDDECSDEVADDKMPFIDTPANALARLKIWIVENKIIEYSGR